MFRRLTLSAVALLLATSTQAKDLAKDLARDLARDGTGLQAVSLAELAADILAGRRPDDPGRAPERIAIDPDLADQLRAAAVDPELRGGAEATLHLAYADGGLRLERITPGERYRTSDACPGCDFARPIRAHTHPYENPISVQDLMVAAASGEPVLAVARMGQMWLALPSALSRTVNGNWATLRYALFGNRLECPRTTPADGWAAATPMGRNVEAAARAGAGEFALALYVADPGEDFRRLGTPAPDLPLLDRGRPFSLDELNAYELTLLRLMHWRAVAGPAADGNFAPDRPDPAFEALMAREPRPERIVANFGGQRFLGDRAHAARPYWFAALPTTVYSHPFADLAMGDLPFVSVQMSDDCGEILVLEGTQAFEPLGVEYRRGWARPAGFSGALHDGWRPLPVREAPRDHHVPWSGS